MIENAVDLNSISILSANFVAQGQQSVFKKKLRFGLTSVHFLQIVLTYKTAVTTSERQNKLNSKLYTEEIKKPMYRKTR